MVSSHSIEPPWPFKKATAVAMTSSIGDSIDKSSSERRSTISLNLSFNRVSISTPDPDANASKVSCVSMAGSKLLGIVMVALNAF